MFHHSTKSLFLAFSTLFFLLLSNPQTAKAQDFVNLKEQKDSLFQVIKKRELQLSDSIANYIYYTKRNQKVVIAKGYNKLGKSVKREKILYTGKGNVKRTVKYKIFASNYVYDFYNVLGLYCRTFNQNIIKAAFFDEKGVHYVIYNNTAIPIDKLVNYKIPKVK